MLLLSNQTTFVHMCSTRHAHQLHRLPILTPWPASQVLRSKRAAWSTLVHLYSRFRLALSCPSHVKGDPVRRQMHCMQSRQRSLKQPPCCFATSNVAITAARWVPNSVPFLFLSMPRVEHTMLAHKPTAPTTHCAVCLHISSCSSREPVLSNQQRC